MSDNKFKTAELGSVSSATMQVEDLIPRFVCVLRSLGHEDGKLDDIERRIETEPESYYNSDDAMYDLNEDLFDMLNEHAPPFCYFGSHPGDGADYGFWVTEELFYDDDYYDGEVLRVSDLEEVPDDATGYVLLEGSHGSATLYEVEIPAVPRPGFRVARNDLREVWSI